MTLAVSILPCVIGQLPARSDRYKPGTRRRNSAMATSKANAQNVKNDLSVLSEEGIDRCDHRGAKEYSAKNAERDYLLIGGTIPLCRRYTTICP